MDALVALLVDVKQSGMAQGGLLGLLHVLIGKSLYRSDGTLVSNGLTWRDVAGYLKKVRWPKEAVSELGLNPAELPPRDRQQYWYAAIARAKVDSPAAAAAGEQLALALQARGYQIGTFQAPGPSSTPSPPP